MEDEAKNKEQLSNERGEMSAGASELEGQNKSTELGDAVLRQKVEHCHYLLKSMNDGFFVADGDGVLTFANKALARIHGFDSPAELVGKRFLDFVAPWMRHEVAEQLREAISTGTAPEFGEVALVRRDGQVVYAEIKPSVALRRDGTIVAHTVVKDITERKKAEEIIQKSHDRLSLALKSSKAGTWDKDIVLDHSTWDDELHALFGLAPSTFSGKSEDFIRMIHPDDRERVIDEIAAAINGDGDYSTSYRVIWPDSSVRYLAGRGKVYRNSAGQAVRMIGVTLDVTDLRQAEEVLWEAKQTYDGLAAAAQVGIYKAKNNERGERVFDYVSPQWCEMNGFEEEEILGNPNLFFDRIHPEEREHFIELNHAARRTGDHFVWEGRMIIRDKVRFMHIESWPIRQKSGHIVWTGVQHDITGRKRAEEEHQRWEQKLIQIHKTESLHRMAGAIAHHFNNLLGAVAGNLELALNYPYQGPQLQARLAQAMAATQRAINISQSMLVYLGQGSGKREPLDLTSVVRNIMVVLLSSLPKDVHLNTILKTPGPLVLLEVGQITNILTSLVTNACEALGTDGGKITVAVGLVAAEEIVEQSFVPLDWEPKEESYAYLAVSDTGCGLDSEDLKNIFDPFFSTKFTGRGLGLSMVLGLVRAHGGAIAVESQIGHYTSFRLLFPLVMGKDQPFREPGTSRSDPT